MVLFGGADKLFYGQSECECCSAHDCSHMFVIHGPDFIFAPPYERVCSQLYKGCSESSHALFPDICYLSSRYHKCSISQHSLHAS
jgi:hypothetical protein